MELVDVNNPIPPEKMEALRALIEGCTIPLLSELAGIEINRKFQPQHALQRDGEQRISIAMSMAYQERLQEFTKDRKGIFMDVDADLLVPYVGVIVDELFDRFEASL